MKIVVFKYNIFEHGYLAFFSMKVTQNSYSGSSNSCRKKFCCNLFEVIPYIYWTSSLSLNNKVICVDFV